MVVGVVPGLDVPGVATGDDAPRPAVAQPRRVHGVLAVVVAGLLGEDAFVVAEAFVVVGGVGERPAGFDELDGCLLYTSDAADDVAGV